MNDFLGGMNPGFPSSFLSVIEESAPTNKLTNAAIRESKAVLSDKGALKQQANSDRFNNQTDGAVPIAQNDIEPPKADDYQRLAQRMGSGAVINPRRAELQAIHPFKDFDSVPGSSVIFRSSGAGHVSSAYVPDGAKFVTIVSGTLAVVAFDGEPQLNLGVANTDGASVLVTNGIKRTFFCEGTRQIKAHFLAASLLALEFHF